MSTRAKVVELLEAYEVDLSPIAEYALYNYLDSATAYDIVKSYLEDELGLEIED
jgi:hypothetical protein